MKANIAVKVIDKKLGYPIEGALVTLSTTQYQLEQYTNVKGQTDFRIDVGGDEIGRHPEEGINIRVRATKEGYYVAEDMLPVYGNQALVLQAEKVG